MVGRPNFVKSAKGSEAQLAEILGTYEFKSGLQCGLSHHWHNWGFLVRLTDGRETCIGNQCGEKHFGRSYFEKEAAFRERTLRPAVLQQLANRRQEMDQLSHTLKANRDELNRWRVRFKKFKGSFPNTSANLADRARRGDNAIYGSEEMNPFFSDDPSGGPKFRRVAVGQIRGLGAFSHSDDSTNPWTVSRVIARIDELQAMNCSKATTVQLINADLDLQGMTAIAQRLHAEVEAISQLLSRANLAALTQDQTIVPKTERDSIQTLTMSQLDGDLAERGRQKEERSPTSIPEKERARRRLRAEAKRNPS
jgi:hypothetical protein